MHFIELQQCATHDRFITQQVYNLDWAWMFISIFNIYKKNK